jgi:L-threonylcarbamoyladenylate synthase
LRPGSISIEALRTFGNVIYENRNAAADEMRASPGLDAKHYAPRARLLVAARERIAEHAADKTKKVGIVLRRKSALIDAFDVRVLADDPDGFASALFATLHDLDDAGCDLIVVAVVDRLTRASGK